MLAAEGLAHPILLSETPSNSSGIEVMDPARSDRLEAYAQAYLTQRPNTNERVAKLIDLSRREFWLLASVAALVLWMGVWPKPFIDVMHASVTDLLTHVSRSKL